MREIALQQAQQFFQAGRAYYHQSRMRETIESFHRARILASSADTRELEEAARFWNGAALHGMGRLHEALAVWAPALTGMGGAVLNADRYMMLTRYLLVAVDLPLSLHVIEQAMGQVEQRLRDTSGGAPPRSRLLLARARLALSRGRYDEAMPFAQEALERSRCEANVYSYSTYLRMVCRAALLNGQPDLVARYLDDWEARENDYLDTKRMSLAAARANLARYLGRYDDALRIAETVGPEGDRSEEIVYGVDASMAFVRACLAAGVPERARASLSHLTRFRHSRIGELRFQVALLLGDYHLTSALRAAHGIAVDLEFGAQKLEPGLPYELQNCATAAAGQSARARGSANWHAARGRRAYRVAKRIGSWLDGLLQIDHHQALIVARGSRSNLASG